MTLRLPADFQQRPLLEFHGRDPHGVSEKVMGQQLEKAFLYQGQPCWLGLDFALHGQCQLASEGLDSHTAQALARHLLGLDQPIAKLEQHCSHHAVQALLIAQRGLRVAQLATPFEALSWAILGQQISVAAAHSLRRRLLAEFAPLHPRGLRCYPDATRIANASEQRLRDCGLSRNKAQTLLTVARACEDDSLLPERDVTPDMAALQQRLLAIRGLGPWSVNYTLLRGYAYLDGSLHGDVVVRRAIGQLLGLAEPPTVKQAEQWLAAFSPWRALLAAHLWQSQAVAA